MKKILIAFFTATVILSGLSVSAKPGDIAGKIYSTDIIAYVNDKPIESYNIGGKTAIIMEDLDESYGFTVWYEDEGRKLTVNTTGMGSYGEKSVERGTVGRVEGSIYETDIKVIFNAQEITGYNIGGRTAVCIEDLGTVEENSRNYEYGYSDYMCKFVWDEYNRTVSLNTFSVNELFIAPKVQMLWNDNKVSLTFDQLEEDYPESSFSDEFLGDTYKISPVIYNDKEIGLMYFDWKGRNFAKLDKHIIYNESKELSDILSYEEAVLYVEENFDILDTRENNKAKYFLAERNEKRYLLIAQKVKGLVAKHTNREATFEEDEEGNTYLSYYGAGTPGTGTVNVREYFMEDELYDFDEYIKKYEASLTEEEIRELNAANEDLNYKIHLTDRREQKEVCTGEFSIKYAPDNVVLTGDAEYFSSSLHSNGNEYEIILDFSSANYAGELILLFKSISSGNQALPIHNEEEKYDIVSEMLQITINGETAEKVAVKTVSWKGDTTVYIYPRDLKPCILRDVREIIIDFN